MDQTLSRRRKSLQAAKTPKRIFDALDREFQFTLDVCAENGAFGVPHCTIEDDGLSKSWGDNVCFCNPPYRELGKWLKKGFLGCLESKCIVVFLLPVNTGSVWFPEWALRGEIGFYKRRIKFGGYEKNRPSLTNMIVVFRPDTLQTSSIKIQTIGTLDAIAGERISR